MNGVRKQKFSSYKLLRTLKVSYKVRMTERFVQLKGSTQCKCPHPGPMSGLWREIAVFNRLQYTVGTAIHCRHCNTLQERGIRWGAGPYTGGGGVEGVGRPPTPPQTPPYIYRMPPAHCFHKYKLRLLYFRMQKLTPYSIKFIKIIHGGACPPTLLGRHGAIAPPPPPPPAN